MTVNALLYRLCYLLSVLMNSRRSTNS